MPVHYVRHELEDSYIHNWLVAGLQAIPVLDLDRFQGQDWKLQIAQRYYEADSAVTQMPVENEPFEVGEAKLEWHYYRCVDDHFVDGTAFYHTCHYLRAGADDEWASRCVAERPTRSSPGTFPSPDTA